MAGYHYAQLAADGKTIENVAHIDDEAVGYELEDGTKWEPWGHDRARAEGWILLHPVPPGVGWVTEDGGVTFHHPDNPNQVYPVHPPKSDRPDFIQPKETP